MPTIYLELFLTMQIIAIGFYYYVNSEQMAIITFTAIAIAIAFITM